MQHRVRRLLLVSLVVLYGAITVAGPALHALPGVEHSGTRSNVPGLGDATNHASSHDCSICQFLAQSQLASDPTSALLIDVTRGHAAAELPRAFPPVIALPSSPRAPPVA